MNKIKYWIGYGVGIPLFVISVLALISIIWKIVYCIYFPLGEYKNSYLVLERSSDFSLLKSEKISMFSKTGSFVYIEPYFGERWIKENFIKNGPCYFDCSGYDNTILDSIYIERGYFFGVVDSLGPKMYSLSESGIKLDSAQGRLIFLKQRPWYKEIIYGSNSFSPPTMAVNNSVDVKVGDFIIGGKRPVTNYLVDSLGNGDRFLSCRKIHFNYLN